MTHFMKVYFHTCQYLFTAYFRKMLSFEMHFLSNFWVQHVFQYLLKHFQEKTQTFHCFCFRAFGTRQLTVLIACVSSECSLKFEDVGSIKNRIISKNEYLETVDLLGGKS